MGILRDVVVSALIFCAVAMALPPLRELVRARQSGARFSAIPVWVWSGLTLSLVSFINAVLISARYTDRTWADWILVPAGVLWVLALAADGIVSRRRDGVPWWRFGAPVVPPPSAAEFTGPAIVLDAMTLVLIERIKNAEFGTTRLSAGYDEEEVDVFLDKLIAVLSEGGQLDQEELRSTQFARTRVRPGYVMHDVDSLLREIA
jgi:DivIVA domain-containing protein